MATASTLRVWPPRGGAAESDASEADTGRLLARAFGTALADLDIDFAAQPRAQVVTALLAACLRDSDGSSFPTDTLWHWSVAARLQGLLAVAYATAGACTTAVATCSRPGCGERIELELALAGFALATPDSIDWQTPQRQTARVRLPSGNDQLAWFHQQRARYDTGYDTGHDAGHDADSGWLARRLIVSIDADLPAVSGQLPSSWIASLDTALADADPLTALTVAAHCPACDTELAIAVDLEYLLLDSCRRRQRALLDDIHHLAGAYHWSEADIVALPAWRRARYLSRIQADSGAYV